MQKINLFFALICCFTLFVACQETTNTDEPTAAEIVNAAEEEEEIDEKQRYADNVYKENCTNCHLPQMSAFAERDWKHGKSWNEVHKSIKYAHQFMEGAGFVGQLPDSAYTKLADYVLVSIESNRMEEMGVEPDYEGIIETEKLTFTLDTIAKGIEVPWGMAQLPNGDFLITDRTGKFYRQSEGKDKVLIEGTPAVRAVGQGGLLDVAVHPDFDNNQTIYLSYSKPKGDKEATTALLMAQLVDDKLVNQKEILEALPYSTRPYHYGSRIVFDNGGHLFVTVGDRNHRDDNPQDLSRSPGKIHRLNLDGSIPEDNPFVGQADAIASIWSYGHRNPQGLVYDSEKDIMWETEHAPRGGDEINIVQKGLNYGWPVISYGINYNGTVFTNETAKDGMEQPVFYYLPSTGTCGLTLVTGDKYPAWKGNLLAGSLRFRYLSRLEIADNKVVGEERLLENIGRLRSVIMGNDGYIYIGVEAPGYVFRLKPKETNI
ncbi:MAG: PQQ-dependent sugar dehydrogenase [Bacteroidota bacterium]